MGTDSVYIIAEAGVNHNGSLAHAIDMVDTAASLGADAIKFQSFVPEEMVKHDAPKAAYQTHSTPVNTSQYDMLKQLQLSESEQQQLFDYCNNKNITFLSTPYDITSADLLINKMELPIIKISSGDIDNAPLLLTAALGNCHVILSTGMATLAEVELALSVLAFGYLHRDKSPSVAAFREALLDPKAQKLLQRRVTLLHCVSNYPAEPKDTNLRAIQTMQQAFQLPVGLSDHTEGTAVSIAAVALGATVIEKHFTLDKSAQGPDHRASLEPTEFKQMVKAIRDVEKAMGNGIKVPVHSELENRLCGRKSLVIRKPVRKGEIITEHHLAIKRPGMGTSPMYYWDCLGQNASQYYAEGDLIL